MQGLAILIAAGCLGQFLHYAKKAMRGQLWGGDTEPNPFRLQFWSDWWCWVTERPGRTASAVVTYCAANEIPQQPCPCLLTAKPVPVGGVVWLAATAVFVVLVAAIIKTRTK